MRTILRSRAAGAIRYLSPLPLSLLLIIPALAGREGVVAPAGYEVIDLGTLGGPGSEGRGINNSGQVTGKAYCPGVCSHAFRYADGVMSDLGTLGGSSSQGNAINDSGQVIGFTSLAGDVRFPAFRYSDGPEGMKDLGTVPGGFASTASAINSAGQVTGSSNIGTNFHAFLYTDSMIDLGATISNTLGYPNSTGLAINAGGDVVGQASTTVAPTILVGFLYPNGGAPIDLTPEGGNAVAINDGGQVTGAYNANDGTVHAYIYQNGVRTDIGTLGGDFTEGMLINARGDVAGRGNPARSRDLHFFIRYSSDGILRNLGSLGGSEIYPYGINANGEVVGYGYTLGDAETHAFVFRNVDEGLVDLNTLIPADSGWVLEEATGINDFGWITGTGWINGERHAFLLKPVVSSDITPPVLTLPSDITTIAIDAAGASVFFIATAVDSTDGNITPSCSPASGSVFPLGTTAVSCTAADAAGNVARGSFAVTVVDATPPVLTLPATLTLTTLSPSGTIVPYQASATDNVSGAVIPSCIPASDTLFPVGTTTVACTARDAAGNVAAGTFTVTVTSSPSELEVTWVAFTNDGEQFVLTMTVRNVSQIAIPTVQVTAATLNRTPATPLPISLGPIGPGAAVTRQVRFPGSAGSIGEGNIVRTTLSWADRSVSLTQRVSLPAATPPLWGWVDLHTHPMSNLAFGGKLFHGAPDVGSLMPAIQMPYDLQCRFDVRATSIEEALSDDAPTHGDRSQSECGDFLRNAAVQALQQFTHTIQQPAHAVGAPTFVNWPRWNDITHQKMWVDWIRRAKEGGLRVMVALSHNNRTLAEAVGTGGPISGVRDDRASSDLQVAEIRSFVNRHPDLMQVALTSAELYQIVQSGRIAVILGVEVDNIGNFNDLPAVTTQMVEGEIDRLYADGVRYAFLIHVADNVFGDTAFYSALFNIANRRETGAFWSVTCASVSDRIGFQSLNFPPVLNPFIPFGFPQPPRAPDCIDGNGVFLGHVNGRSASGLTPLGEFALKIMMKRGMIVDIDHVSDRGVDTALRLAEAVQPGGGYPLVSGHSAVRDGNHFKSENHRTRAQLQRIGCLQGMFGLGTDGAEAYEWARQYVDAFDEMGRPTHLCPDKTALGRGRVAFGTDINSLVGTPRPTMTELKPGTLPRRTDIYNPSDAANDNPLLPVQARSTTGTRTWDYNFDGVAHYGMFADFVKDVRTAPVGAALSKSGRDIVDNHLLRSADYFFRMWQKIESQKQNVR